MPSYTSYMRQMAVLDADDNEIESWITVKGNHIPIRKGQSKEDAVKSFIEKKGGSGEKKSEPKSNKQVFYKNISGKQIGSPKGRTFIENEIMTEKEMAKRGFDPTDKRFERKELGKNDHHFFFGARFENAKPESKEKHPAEFETEPKPKKPLAVHTEEPKKWGAAEINKRDFNFRRQMLGRLKQDNDYFLGNGGRAEKHLWAGNVKEQIQTMRDVYKALPEKERPEWLTEKQINDYEKKMVGGEKKAEKSKPESKKGTGSIIKQSKVEMTNGLKHITHTTPEGYKFSVWESSNDPGWKTNNLPADYFETEAEATEAATKQFEKDLEYYNSGKANKKGKQIFEEKYGTKKTESKKQPKDIMDWKFEDVMKLPSSDPRVHKYIAKNTGVKQEIVAQVAEALPNTEDLYFRLYNMPDVEKDALLGKHLLEKYPETFGTDY